MDRQHAGPSGPLFIIADIFCRRFLSPNPKLLARITKTLMRVFGRHRAPKLRSYAVTSPQLSALAPADEFAAHRFFRPDLHQRLVAGLWRCILGVCTCRKPVRITRAFIVISPPPSAPERLHGLPSRPPVVGTGEYDSGVRWKKPQGIRALRLRAGFKNRLCMNVPRPGLYKLAPANRGVESNAVPSIHKL